MCYVDAGVRCDSLYLPKYMRFHVSRIRLCIYIKRETEREKETLRESNTPGSLVLCFSRDRTQLGFFAALIFPSWAALSFVATYECWPVTQHGLINLLLHSDDAFKGHLYVDSKETGRTCRLKDLVSAGLMLDHMFAQRLTRPPLDLFPLQQKYCLDSVMEINVVLKLTSDMGLKI